MATGTHAGSTWNTTAGNKTVVATPAASDLIVVVHGMSGWASADDSVITDNNADGLGAYTRYGTATVPLSQAGGTAGALWFSVRNALVGSATSTTFTVTNTGDTGGGLTVLSFSGMTRVGAAAVKQTIGENAGAESPPTITFGATTLTGNPVILAVLGEDNPPALTPPTGFTEAVDTGWGTPNTGVEVCWDDAGNTATLFSWSGGALTDHNEIGIELDARGTAAQTGTITASVTEADIVAGGKTAIITLTGDTWIAAGAASFDLQRDEIIAGFDSAQSEATGWDLVPKALQSLGGVVRTSDTVVTVTWDAFATYNITANETITMSVPGTALTGAVGIVATPTFVVTTAASGRIMSSLAGSGGLVSHGGLAGLGGGLAG